VLWGSVHCQVESIWTGVMACCIEHQVAFCNAVQIYGCIENAGVVHWLFDVCRIRRYDYTSSLQNEGCISSRYSFKQFCCFPIWEFLRIEPVYCFSLCDTTPCSKGGLRIGWLTSLKIKNVQFDEHGAVIKVRGKTGERRVRIVMFASSLAKWMEMHPDGDDKEAPLWVNLSNNYSKKGVTYEGLYQKLKRIAKKAGVKKRLNFHKFRHSRATHLAQQLTEAQMNVYFGWVQGSDMPATYVHLSGRDVDDRILQIHGLRPKDEEAKQKLKPQKCPRCQYINAPVSRYCGRCGTVLDEGERLKLEMKTRTVSKDFPDLTIEDIGLLEKMKEFRDMLELFEKHPELFSKMRAMVEGR
jgi:hypothetical protein